MRTRLRFVAAGVLLVVCLAACGPSPNSASTSTPTAGIDQDIQQQAVVECLDLWLNTEASPDIIDAGMNGAQPSGDVSSTPAVTQDADGVYHSHSGTNAFADWIYHYAVPWSDISGAIFAGWGCPYDPAVKAQIEQAEQKCLDIWANNDPSQSAIDAGLATALPDSTSVQPVITRDASGAYHVDVTAEGFQAWVDSTDYYVPWENITSLTLFGGACPYVAS